MGLTMTYQIILEVILYKIFEIKIKSKVRKSDGNPPSNNVNPLTGDNKNNT
jgi:hypothetical protein